MPILRNAISRNSKARGVIATARMSRPGASTAKTSVNWGVDMKSAHSGATANVASDSTAPIMRFTVTTAPGRSFSSRRRWIRALEKPWSNSSPTTPMYTIAWATMPNGSGPMMRASKTVKIRRDASRPTVEIALHRIPPERPSPIWEPSAPRRSAVHACRDCILGGFRRSAGHRLVADRRVSYWAHPSIPGRAGNEL